MAESPIRTGHNPYLLEMLEKVASERASRDFKRAFVAAGGDPSMGGAAGGDPSMGGAPPGGDPSQAMGGGAPAPGPDPAAGGGIDPATIQAIATQVMTQIQQSGMGGGAGGPGGKGKNPKEQIQASQMKIIIHMLAQLCQKAGIQVDPMIMVPPSDPGSDQMAMQEMQTSSMSPSTDPTAGAAAGGAPAPAPDPSQGGAPPIAPMTAQDGPIGKQAGWDLGFDEESDLGRPFLAEIDAMMAEARPAASGTDRIRHLLAGI